MNFSTSTGIRIADKEEFFRFLIDIFRFGLKRADFILANFRSHDFDSNNQLIFYYISVL